MISVIVPVYNKEKYIRGCLDSIAAQTYGDFEVILVDDGSADGSAAIIKEYTLKDDRFRLISQKNSGAAAARNRGIDEAQGDWFVFIDADDTADPEMLGGMLKAAEKSNRISFVQCGMTVTETDGRTTTRAVNCDTLLTRKEAMLGFFKKESPITASFSDKLIRRRLFDNGLRMAEGIGNEDTEIIPRLIDASEQILIIAEPYYRYLKHPYTSSSYNNFSLKIYGFLPELDKFKGMCEDRYPECLPWFEFYMANTLNGMYEYLSDCDDADRYRHIGRTLRKRLYRQTGVCMRIDEVSGIKAPKLREYRLRALLGIKGLSALQKLMRR